MAEPTDRDVLRPSAPIIFGRFVLLPSQRALLDKGQPAKLGGRAFDLLEVLVELRDQVVSRQTLFDRVWPGRVVEDDNLKVQVMALRKVLGPQAIATVPGRGYRFVAQVQGEAAAPPPAAHAEQHSRGAMPGTPLPLPAHPLIGREDGLQRGLELIESHALVTICGPGGIGKTRLALACASELGVRPPDGVWFVDLSALTQGAGVEQHITQALGFPVEADGMGAQALARRLAGLDALIVLDNCEHVIDPVRRGVAACLAPCPRLRWLCTSQEPLRIRGERLLRLPPLPQPPEGMSLAQAARHPAVELFSARVAEMQPGFALTERQLATVIEICRRLEGNALALELAAARVPSLGLEGVRLRLDEQLRLLIGGAHDAPARHRTLRATLEWSHGLLSSSEQQVLHHLGVFAGYFQLQDVQAVAGQSGPDLDEWAVLDRLGTLVDRSLVQAEGDELPRYRLLDSTRAYALEQLRSRGELHGARVVLARRLLVHLRAADATSLATPPLVWVRQMAPWADDLRECLRWAMSHDESALAAELIAWAGAWWNLTGLAAEVVAAHRVLCAAGLPALESESHARYLLTLSRLAAGLALPANEGLPLARQASAAMRQLGDHQRLYMALYHELGVAERIDDFATIDTALAEMQTLEQAHWPGVLRHYGAWARARQLPRLGQAHAYRHAFYDLVRAADENGDERAAWLSAHIVSLAELVLGEADRAVRVMSGVTDRIRTAGLQRHFVFQFALFALTLVAKGDLAQLQPSLREAIALLRPSGALWWFDAVLGRVAALRGDFASAARLLGWANAQTQARGDRRGPVIQGFHERLQTELEQRFHAPLLRRLEAEGAAMDDDAVVRATFGTA
jgi:predicted ATPase/DNA-binding winged helix-turn-helix (wHTH) protein